MMNDIPAPAPAIFGWSNGRIVLLIDRDEHTWVVARGWRQGDALVDVRRWHFDSDRRAIGQIRRLVREATDQPDEADEVANRASAWLAAAEFRMRAPQPGRAD